MATTTEFTTGPDDTTETRGTWASELRNEAAASPFWDGGPRWRGVKGAIESAPLQRLGQLGWVAKGIVYGLMGVLMFRIAIDAVGSGEGEEATPQGAIDAIAESSAGSAVLYVLAAGLVLFSLWRLATVFLPGDIDAESLGKRVAYFFSAATYGFLAYLSIAKASGSSSSGSGSGTETLLDTLVQSQPGRVLLGLVGVGSVVLAGYFVRKGVQHTYREQLSMFDATDTEREIIDKLGMLGWIARAVVVLLVGLFLVDAGFLNDPENAKGLDAILTDVAGMPWGAPLIATTGTGLVLYGIFCGVSARHRVLRAP